MSYTSLWEINKDWSGREHTDYRNSWLFCPVVWDILMCKYILPSERMQEFHPFAATKTFLSWTCTFDKEEANRRFGLLNERINKSAIQFDRVLWELSNMSVFNAKDKDFVAACIEAFVNFRIDDNPEYEDADHIKERFLEVAKDIRNLPRRVKYFVIHPTSFDDNVEWWFYRKRLCSWDKFVCEFTLIENDKVVGFSTNLEMCKENDDGQQG